MFWDGVPSRTSGRARIGEQSEEEPDYNISRRCVLYCNSLLPLNEKRGAIVHNTFHKNIGRLPIFNTQSVCDAERRKGPAQQQHATHVGNQRYLSPFSLYWNEMGCKNI
jgi:hypothetical protein